MEVVRIDESRYGDWETYLDSRERDVFTTLYHRTNWDRVWAAYGLKVVRLAALEGDQVVGVLPLVHQKSMLFGNRLVSLPWFDGAGVISSTANVRDMLLRAACDIARDTGATGLHVRQFHSYDEHDSARTDKVLMRLALPDDSEALWDGFSPKVRNQVRKAEKSGLDVQTGGLELLNQLYRVYSTNMRDLGSPSHSRSFLTAVLDAFSDSSKVFCVTLNGKTIGAGMTLSDGDTMEIPWASSLRQHNTLCVNHRLYWSILREACESGFKWFHFGRSTVDSGTYRFKRQWGAEPHTLHWYEVDARSGEFVGVERNEESFGLGRRMWTKLPLSIARRLGPRIVRHVA